MKRIINLYIYMWVIAMLLSSCANQNNKSLLDFNALSFVKLCDYDGAFLSDDELIVTDDDIETFILMDLSYYGKRKEITDRNYLIDEDIAVLELNGDTSETEYVIGSCQLSEQFDEALIGMKIGETKDVVVLSENNCADIYKVKLKAIRRFVTLQDKKQILDFYSVTSMKEVYLLIEHEIKKNIIFENVYEHICKNSYIIQIPAVWDEYIRNTISDVKKLAEENEMSFEEYTGMSEIEFPEFLVGEVQEIMILKSVCEKENVIISREKYHETIKNISKLSGVNETEVENSLRESVIIIDMLKELVKSNLFEKQCELSD